jgi:hypothetical protein
MLLPVLSFGLIMVAIPIWKADILSHRLWGDGEPIRERRPII